MQLDPRDLDAWLAERLFGWRHIRHKVYDQGGPTEETLTYWTGDPDAFPIVWTRMAKFSTTYEGMGRVLESMRWSKTRRAY